jgi:hypothetical protein
MAGHRFSTLSIPRRILRVLGPIAAAVVLLALPSQAWGANAVAISNNIFPPSGTPPAVGSSVTQNVLVTYSGSTPVVISSIVLQSAGWEGKEYTLNSVTGCVVGDGTTSYTSVTCTLNVTYTPAFPGSLASPMLSRNATLVITDSVNTMKTFGLAGPATGALGQVIPGTISIYAGLPYTNAGNPPLFQNNGLGQGPSGYTADGVPATTTKFTVGVTSYSGQPMALDSAGNLYAVDPDDSIIRKIDNTTNHVVTTVAGTPKMAGSTGTSGEGGLATAAKLTTPYSMALDSADNIFFTNYSGQDNSGAHYMVLRKVHAGSGLLTSVAGQNFNGSTYSGSGTCPTSNPTSWQCGDGGQAADAELKGVTNFVIDASGNIYLWEGLGGYLREINASTGVINTVATAAQLNVNPTNNSNGGITLAADGNIYIVVMDQTSGYAAIREYNTSTQAITLLAGNISSNTAGCVTNPTTIQAGFLLSKLFLSGLSPLSSDASGNLYLTTDACGSSPAIYRINLNSQMAYPLMYDYSEWGIADEGTLAGAFNGFYGYYVNPTFAIPDNAGNLYFFNWYGQIGLLSGSNAELSYPFVFPPNTPLPQYDFSASADQIVTYANVGNQNEPIPVYSLAAGTNFTVDTNPPNDAPYCITANTLVTGTTCNIYLQFTPTVVGAVSDTLNIGSSDSQTVTLNGAGEANSKIVFSQAAINFGNVVIHTSSAAQPLTISNPGTAALTFSYTSSGTNSGYFTITPGTCVVDAMGNYDVAIGGSCTIQVTYKPSYVESDSASIQFSSNISGGINAGTQVPLTGSGIAAVVQPAASLNPSPLNFPGTTSGSTAQLTTVLSQTATGATLTISSIAISGTNAANFSIDSSSSCNGVANLVGVNSCNIVVDFKPTSAASYTATLSVADNAAGSPQTVVLNGTGTSAPPLASISFGPSPLTFPLTVAGSTSSLTATLTNNTTASFSIYNINFTGTDGKYFGVDSTSTCTPGVVVPVSGSCTVVADFQPGYTKTSYTATLSVGDSSTTTTPTISITGTSAAPGIGISPSPLVFPATTVQLGGQLSVTVTNTGAAPLSFVGATPFTIAGATVFTVYPNGSCSSMVSLNETLAPGATCTISIQFWPQNAGAYAATLTIADNAASYDQTVPITGVGQAGQLQFYPALLSPYAGVIGNGNACADAGNGGPALSAQLCTPSATAADMNGNIYIADPGKNVVRKVDSSGNITDFAGNLGGGCDSNSPGNIGDGCPAANATLKQPSAVAVDGFGNVYISDTGNARVRVVNAATNIISTYAGNGTTGAFAAGAATSVPIVPNGIALDPSGNLYIANAAQNIVIRVTPGQNGASAYAIVFAGGTNDGPPMYQIQLNAPMSVAADLNGNLYIADTGNNLVREFVNSGDGGTITTVAGTGTAGDTGDGGPATSAEIYANGVAVDAFGDLYISTGSSIRKVDFQSGSIDTLAGGGSGSTGGPAPSANLSGVGFPGIDLAGDLLIPSGSGVAIAGPQGDLEFGSQNVTSTSAAQTVIVTNTGNAPVYFYNPKNESVVRGRARAALRGAAPEGSIIGGGVGAITGDFAIASNTCTGGENELGPGSSCTIGVTFTPTATGARTGSITLYADGPNNIPAVIQLSGTGTQAQLGTVATPQISPATGAYNTNQSVTIGDSTTGATICYTTDNSTPTASNGSCTHGTAYSAAFSVAQTGTTVQAIGTLSGDTNSAVASATYTLQAVAPSLTPPGGTYSGPQSVTLATTTTGAQIFYTTDGSAPTGTAPSILFSGTPISVAKSGTVINAITVNSGYQNSTVSTGTYTIQSPAVTLLPPSLGFGSQTAGTTSASQSTTLTNSGTSPLTITAIALAGTNPADFTESDNCVSASPLAENASCTITVKFAPAATASYSASVSITDNASNSPQTVPLTGTGTAPAAPIASLTAPAAFSANTGSTSAAQAATLSNTGNAALTISGITIAGTNPTDFAITTGTNACGTTLAAGASCSIYVTFTPASAASFAATLSVADNAANSPQTVALTGTGTAPVVPNFTVASPTGAQTVQPGGAATYTINVTPVNGAFTSAVTLTASGLPAGATATFVPASVTPGSAEATSQLTIQTAATKAEAVPGSPWPLALPTLSLIGLFFVPGKRRRRWITLCVLLVASLGAIAALSGCGGGFGLAKVIQPQSYTVTVTGTSGTDIQTTTVQLTVE